MDLAQFEKLETAVAALLKAFTHVKSDNQQLSQRVQDLEETLASQQQEMARLQSAQTELQQLRSHLQLLRQEREIIQQKLRQMLSTIKWLEEHTHIKGDARA